MVESRQQPQTRPRLDTDGTAERSVRGIEFGVSANGVPYMTRTGLAKVCGTDTETISRLSDEWEADAAADVTAPPNTPTGWLRERMSDEAGGYNAPKLYFKVRQRGVPLDAYPDLVCMTLIEYFAFETETPTEEAERSFRAIARHGLRDFIYTALSCKPGNKWKQFYDRASLARRERAPNGYFGVCDEINDIVVDLINAELTVNETTIPDISAGTHWAEFWSEERLAEKFGETVPWPHALPENHRVDGNPKLARAYPNKALTMFRKWFRNVYLPQLFPSYILGKAKLLEGGVDEAARTAALYEHKRSDHPGPTSERTVSTVLKKPQLASAKSIPGGS